MGTGSSTIRAMTAAARAAAPSSATCPPPRAAGHDPRSGCPPGSELRASMKGERAGEVDAQTAELGAIRADLPPCRPTRCAGSPTGARRTSDGRGPALPRGLAPVDHPRGRELAAAAANRLHRPVPGAPAQPGHRRRGDSRRADRPGPGRQGPLHRVLVVLRLADRGGAVGRTGAAPGAVLHRAPAVLDPGARYRGG